MAKIMIMLSLCHCCGTRVLLVPVGVFLFVCLVVCLSVDTIARELLDGIQ